MGIPQKRLDLLEHIGIGLHELDWELKFKFVIAALDDDGLQKIIDTIDALQGESDGRSAVQG